MNLSLKDVLDRIGSIPIASHKGEITFLITDENDSELTVVYQDHLPDGSYAEAVTWTFQLVED